MVPSPRVSHSWALIRPPPWFSPVSGSTGHCRCPPDLKRAQAIWLAGVADLPIVAWPSSSPSAVGTFYGSSPAAFPS